MKILIVGSGGREHALAWKIKQSPKAETVFVAPGNAGTALEPGVLNVDIQADDIAGLLSFALLRQIDLTIIGPELPLVNGIVDHFTAAGLACFGPSARAARLEGSKSFCKDFMAKHAIPTAQYQTFTDKSAAIEYIRRKGAPIVVKADGLAAGKGVIVAHSEQQAIDAVDDMLSGNIFGEAGHQVVIEEFLQGEEASFIVIADGLNAIAMATSQDHKTRDDGDTGPNTGGMGAYSPAPVVSAEIQRRVMEEVIYPTLQGMREDGCEYVGFLYAGLMIDKHDNIRVLEYNCRFGDPETQPIMMRLKTDLLELCQAAANRSLAITELEWDPRCALGVVLTAGGYPDSYEKHHEIVGLPIAETLDCKVFHAGTLELNHKIVTNGGRVLCVCALGETIREAQERAYSKADMLAKRLLPNRYWI
jgi:phosphoribosylamine---glycine ligase